MLFFNKKFLVHTFVLFCFFSQIACLVASGMTERLLHFDIEAVYTHQMIDMVRSDGSVIGTLKFYKVQLSSEAKGYISSIYISDEYQRRGLGSILLSAALLELSTLDLVEASLAAMPITAKPDDFVACMADLKRFYAKMGGICDSGGEFDYCPYFKFCLMDERRCMQWQAYFAACPREIELRVSPPLYREYSMKVYCEGRPVCDLQYEVGDALQGYVQVRTYLGADYAAFNESICERIGLPPKSFDCIDWRKASAYSIKVPKLSRM